MAKEARDQYVWGLHIYFFVFALLFPIYSTPNACCISLDRTHDSVAAAATVHGSGGGILEVISGLAPPRRRKKRVR